MGVLEVVGLAALGTVNCDGVGEMQRLRYATGKFVVRDQACPGVFHGRVRIWQELTPEMKNALVKSGMATRNGSIMIGP